MRLRVFLAATTASAVVAAGCFTRESASIKPLSGDPTQPDCGFILGSPGPDEPPSDPCGPGSVLVHGPVTLDPDPGMPALDNAIFSVAEPGFVCVAVDADRIASASGTLDGAPFSSTGDFNATVTELNRVSPAMPPDADLEWEVRATPNGSLTYDVSFAPLDLTPRDPVTGPAGRLSLYNLHDGLDPFSPADENGIRDTVTLSVTAEVDSSGINTSSPNHFLRIAFEIASPVSCIEAVRLVTEVPITAVTPTTPAGDSRIVAFVEWDGRDTAGDLVEDGAYFYRAAVDLIKENPAGVQHVRDAAVSEILTVTVDNTPPNIVIASPIAESGVSIVDEGVVLIGSIIDESGVASASVEDVFGAEDLVLGSKGVFAVFRPLDVTGEPVEKLNVFTFRASDPAGNEGTLDWLLYATQPFVQDLVVVEFTPETTLSQLDTINSGIGATIAELLPEFDCMIVVLPPGTDAVDAVHYYESGPGVAGGLGDHVISAGLEWIGLPDGAPFIPNDPILQELTGELANGGELYLWNLEIVAVPDVWQELLNLGLPVGDPMEPEPVGVIGQFFLYTHEDLSANLFINQNEGDGDGECEEEDFDGEDDDPNGIDDDVCGVDFRGTDESVPPSRLPDVAELHETQIASVIGSPGNDGVGVAGISWVARMLPLKTVGPGLRNTRCSPEAQAILYGISQGVRVFVLAYSGPVPAAFERIGCPAFKRALDALREVDGVLVNSAGNGSPDALGRLVGFNIDEKNVHPGSFYDSPAMIVVGGTLGSPVSGAEEDLYRDPASNFGATNVDIGAPSGPNHAVAFYGRNLTPGLTDVYAHRFSLVASGTLLEHTSGAAAIVAGIIALMRATHRVLNPGAPELTLSEIRRNLFVTASPGPEMGFAVNGVPNAFDAIFNPPPPASLQLTGTISEGAFLRDLNEADVRGLAFHPNDEFAAIASFDGRVSIVDVSGDGWAIEDASDPRFICQFDNGAASDPTSVDFGPGTADVAALVFGGQDNVVRVARIDTADTTNPCCELGTFNVGNNALSVRFNEDASLVAVGTNHGLRVLETGFSGEPPACADGATLTEVLDLSFSENVHGVDWAPGLLAYTVSGTSTAEFVARESTPPFAEINTFLLPSKPRALDLDFTGPVVHALVGLKKKSGVVGTARILRLGATFFGGGDPEVWTNNTTGTIFGVAAAGDGQSLVIAEESISVGRPGRSAVGYAYLLQEFEITWFDNTGTDFKADLRTVAVSSDGARVVFGGEDVDGPTRVNVRVYETGL